jgi:CheY-like chemotaxis protein
MKILLVDDTPRHRKAGRRQLEALGHDVTVLIDYSEAQKLVQVESFDVALLDLLMPAESTTLGSKAIEEHVGREIAIGFPLALTMAMAGIPRVAVATDTNHHHHPMSAAVDWFYGEKKLVVNGAVVIIMHSPMDADGAKDWGKILERLLAVQP